MKVMTRSACCAIALAWVGTGFAQVPPTAAPDQAALLQSKDPKLAANKKLVFDMWRAIIQGAHTELAPKYFTKDYIQHNPTVPTGRAGLKEIAPHLSPDLHYTPGMIVAEGNYVMVHGRYVGWGPKPVVGVDIFRISNGVLVEHWDVLQEEVPATQTKSGIAMFDPQETA